MQSEPLRHCWSGVQTSSRQSGASPLLFESGVGRRLEQLRFVLRRQGSQVRSDERSEDRPKAHPVGRAKNTRVYSGHIVKTAEMNVFEIGLSPMVAGLSPRFSQG